IHGATMASREFDDETEAKKPTVQVGDPFAEKLLLEACLEAMSKGTVVGIQDMGAAGLTSSSVEMASRAGRGMFIDLSKIPAREENMRPDEFLLSESQERMLLVIKPGDEAEVKRIFEKWDLDASVIGRVTDDGRFRAEFRGEEVVNIPVKALTEAAPVYERICSEPQQGSVGKYFPEREVISGGRYFPERAEAHLPAREGKISPHTDNDCEWERIFETLVTSPNLCSRRWIYRQYDQQVKTNTVISSGGDAAVIRIKGTDKGIAATTDCNSRICEIDPYQGGMMAVAEAARNLVCVGAQPIGVSDCLNFGSPENPEIMWQFKRSIEGISDACRYFNIPVVSGNVSFYNETNGRAIAPTPTIAMVGLITQVKNIMTHYFKKIGHLIVLIGEDINSSEAKIDLDLEKRVHEAVLDLISKGIVQSAHDCSEGGLAMTLLESAFEREMGVNIDVKTEPQLAERRLDHLLFGEAPSRVVVSMDKGNFHKFSEICKKYGAPYLQIGETIKDRFVYRPHFNLGVKLLKTLWGNAFEKIVSH
ncbi:MAG: AIR synthase-related protein, partial [Deltaproteobacteria bacterium]